MYRLLLSILLIIVNGISFTPAQTQEEIYFEGMDIIITIRENPTTGYIWSYTIEPEDMLTCVKDHYQPYAASLYTDGGGGSRQYVFQAGGTAGIAIIRLILIEPNGMASREMALEARLSETGVESVERIHTDAFNADH